MPDLYDDTLAAGGATSGISVTPLTDHALNVTRPAVVEVQHAGGWTCLRRLKFKRSLTITPTAPTIRIRNLSDQPNAVRFISPG